MRLRNQRELKTTQKKLRLLEEHYAQVLAKQFENKLVQELTLRSLKRTINQLKEEIAVFQAHVPQEKE